MTAPRSAEPWTRRSKLLLMAITTALLVTFVGSVLALTAALYSRSLSDARSVAVALQQYALRTVGTGDLITEIVRDGVLARGSLAGLPEDQTMHRMLADLSRRLPAGSGIVIVDDKGIVVSSWDSLPAPPTDLSDRSWFKAHQTGADFVLTEALRSRVTGRLMFILTRAVRRPDGSLMGIVNLGLPSDSLIGEHALPQYGGAMVLTLLTQDGGLLARSSFPDGLLGQRFPLGALEDDQVGLVAARDVDGRTAVEATDPAGAYGLVARASIPLADVLHPLWLVIGLGAPLVCGMLWLIRWLIRSLDAQQRLLAQSTKRLGAVIDASHLGSWHLDVMAGTSQMNARWAEIVGSDASRIAMSPSEWEGRLHPDERDSVLTALQDALSGKTPFFHIEHRLRHEAGHWVWVLDSGSVVERDALGNALVMTGTLLDISERREAEMQVRVLMRELDHRAKNLLAVVYSMINLMRGSDVAQFKSALMGRVKALGQVHSLLSHSTWKGVDLAELIRTETAAYQSDDLPRIVSEGPALVVGPAAAQALAMVVHELMTNSAKYGALSAAGGRVGIDWSQDCDASAAPGLVRITWRESGGPNVVEPIRKGFGTTLLNAMVKDQLDGTIRAEWLDRGAVFTITFPPHVLRRDPTRDQNRPTAA